MFTTSPILFCIMQDKMNNEIFNVGFDTNISKLELCKRIKKILPNLNIIESQYKKDPIKEIISFQIKN